MVGQLARRLRRLGTAPTVLLGACAVVAIGAGTAYAATPAAHGSSTPPAAVSTTVEKPTASDTDNVQSGDQTGPDAPGTAAASD
jgi:hypothetical protein